MILNIELVHVSKSECEFGSTGKVKALKHNCILTHKLIIRDSDTRLLSMVKLTMLPVIVK